MEGSLILSNATYVLSRTICTLKRWYDVSSVLFDLVVTVVVAVVVVVEE